MFLVQIQGTKQKYTEWKIITKPKKWFTLFLNIFIRV